MISFLSAIIVMIAIGTVIQRADIFSGGEEEPGLALVDDNFVLPANTLQKLDIFANDTGISKSDMASLTILSEPACGRVLVGGGVVKYYGSDECVGEQKIIYTLSALPESQVATVIAFVTSELHPEIVPGKKPTDAKPATDADQVANSGENETRGGEKASRAETSEALSDGTDADNLEEQPFDADSDSLPSIAGGATPAEAATREGAEILTEASSEAAADDTADDAEVTSEKEPSVGATDIAEAPQSPEISDKPSSEVLSVIRDDDTSNALVPDQPKAGDDVVGSAGEATLSLAVVPRRDELRDPTIADGDVLNVPDTRDENGRIDGGPGAEAALEGRDAPSSLPTETAALGPDAGSGAADALDTDTLTEGVATGQVPVPVKRAATLSAPAAGVTATDEAGLVGGATSSGDGSTSSDPERDIAALETERDTPPLGSPETRVPLGTDVVLAPLGAETSASEVEQGDLVATTDDPALRARQAESADDDLLALSEPGTAATGIIPGNGAPDVPRSALGRIDDLDVGARALTDTDSKLLGQSGGAAVPLRGEPGGAPLTGDRAAALAPDLAGVPATDQLRIGDAEPDPVGDVIVPGTLRADIAGAGEDLAGIDPDSQNSKSVPEADRVAALVGGAEASAYSFFTRLPRGARIRGNNSAATTKDPMNSSAPILEDTAPRVAALPVFEIDGAVPDSAVSDPVSLGKALNGFVVDPEDGEPAQTNEDGTDIASLPAAGAECVAPPSAELEIRKAARTVVRLTAPCQADTVAELNYSGLRLAIPLDREGNGSVQALGFEANSAALIRFSDGVELDFDLPFRNVDKIDRVAVVCDLPVALELHALEFGARTGDNAHVHPKNPRGYSDVRRSGGGFLHNFRAYAGVGQNAQIYTHWRRRGSGGIVKLMIDYASRNRDRLAGTCGGGDYAAPGFLILRSASGQIERPIIRRLAAISCSSVSQEIGDKRLISEAIDDLVISN